MFILNNLIISPKNKFDLPIQLNSPIYPLSLSLLLSRASRWGNSWGNGEAALPQSQRISVWEDDMYRHKNRATSPRRTLPTPHRQYAGKSASPPAAASNQVSSAFGSRTTGIFSFWSPRRTSTVTFYKKERNAADGLSFSTGKDTEILGQSMDDLQRAAAMADSLVFGRVN